MGARSDANPSLSSEKAANNVAGLRGVRWSWEETKFWCFLDFFVEKKKGGGGMKKKEVIFAFAANEFGGDS